jgi:hypothetical protein
VEAAGKLPTSADAHTLLLFTLINGPHPVPAVQPADATTTATDHASSQQATPQHAPGFVSWHFQQFQDDYLDPLADALAPVLQLDVRSQVRFIICLSALGLPECTALHHAGHQLQ